MTAESFHRIDIRRDSRLAVRNGNQVVADTRAPLALHESGFAPRWYVPRRDVVFEALHPLDERQLSTHPKRVVGVTPRQFRKFAHVQRSCTGAWQRGIA